MDKSATRKIPVFEHDYFPALKDTVIEQRSIKKIKDSSDPFFIYDVPEQIKNLYLNRWFKDKSRKHCIWTVKRCDEETAYFLGDYINCFSLDYRKEYDSNKWCCRGVMHSIDDTSYNVWWNGKTQAEANEFYNNVKKFISKSHVFSGKGYIQWALKNGATDYDTN